MKIRRQNLKITDKKRIEIEQKTIRIAEQEIHYWKAGHGEPVVMVHGFASSALWWRRNIGPLTDRYSVYLIDLPGFASMRHTHKSFSIATSIVYLYRWMQVCNIAEVHMVGHSLGGYICMAFSVAHPNLVRSLTLIDTIGIAHHRSILQMLLPLVRSTFDTSPALWFTQIYDFARAHPASILRAADEIVHLDGEKVIAAVQAPTLLCWGQHDRLVPLLDGIKIHSMIKGSQIVILPHASHVSMFDQAPRFNVILRSFLASCDQTLTQTAS